ncbi:MAG: hypothetical protein KBA46_03045 [Candidatus Omnitrophica bacterium]|nr:hypothetical protein [Candidatus Omnitrophota bacterium]
MQIVMLTSDIIEARIVAKELLDAKRKLTAVIFEKKTINLKMRVKLFLLLAARKINHLRIIDIKRDSAQTLIRQTDNINSSEISDLLRSLQPDVIVVVGTRKLKKEIFSCAKNGAINLHGGILPYYRGADSVFWALWNNDPHNIGVTIHMVEEGLDCGNILLTCRLEMTRGDTLRSLRDKIMFLGARKINEALTLIESNVAKPVTQNETYARKYQSATPTLKKQLVKRLSQMRCRESGLKQFGEEGVCVTEVLSQKPLLEAMRKSEVAKNRFFCLRIDADEFDAGVFERYKRFFKDHAQLVSIFFNAHQYAGAGRVIRECSDMGLDVQSHGYYHYAYNDYESNRFNIAKAKNFFLKLGIETKGFVAPMGKWNESLMQALEDEGYLYSSDFSYDYLGFPSYPLLKKGFSRVLEIPAFPIAPDKFFRAGHNDVRFIERYYKRAIDEMTRCGIPIILYAHPMAPFEIIEILGRVIGYALDDKQLRGCTMTQLYEHWSARHGVQLASTDSVTIPAEFDSAIFGKRYFEHPLGAAKRMIKERLDFERLTPDDELRCKQPRRFFKTAMRRILPEQMKG